MKLLSDLQQRFGFTRSEILVIVFLSAALLAGAGIRRLSPGSGGGALPQFDYRGSDRASPARIRALANLAPPGGAPGRSGGAAKPQPAPGSVDLNSADSSALVTLPGIGPAYARRIIAYRTAHGAFAGVGDLVNVKGIGPARLEKLRPFVTARRGRSP